MALQGKSIPGQNIHDITPAVSKTLSQSSSPGTFKQPRGNSAMSKDHPDKQRENALRKMVKTSRKNAADMAKVRENAPDYGPGGLKPKHDPTEVMLAGLDRVESLLDAGKVSQALILYQKLTQSSSAGNLSFAQRIGRTSGLLCGCGS